jgi:hypothetical protein
MVEALDCERCEERWVLWRPFAGYWKSEAQGQGRVP